MSAGCARATVADTGPKLLCVYRTSHQCHVGLLSYDRRCVEQEVEVVFALSRKHLGRVYGFKKRVSAVAVLELNGIHDQHRQLVRLAAEGREAWQQREAEEAARGREGRAAGGAVVVGAAGDRDEEQSSSGEEDEGEDGEGGEEGRGVWRGGEEEVRGREGEGVMGGGRGGVGVGVEAGAGRRLNAAAPSFVPHSGKAE